MLGKYDPCSGFQMHTFGNGLEVLHKQIDRNLLYGGFSVYVGSREDPPGRSGLDHLLEHLLAENLPGGLPVLERILKKIGKYGNFGTTDFLATTYDFCVIPDKLPQALDIFGHMLMDCQIVSRIEHAKQVVVSEYWGLYSSETERELLDQIQQLLFRGHPQLEMFHGNLGHPEEFMACTPKELQAFYDRYYTPSNMSALFVGDIRFEELIEMLEQSPFGQSKPGQRNIPVQIPFQVPVPEKNELRFIGESSIQSIRCLFECVIPYTIAPTTLHLVIFEEMLRDYLLDELRLSTENPLTYEVTVGSYFWQDCQELYITLEVMSEEAIAFIKKAIAQPWVTRERFTEAKEGLLKEYFMPDWSYQQVFGYCLENLLRYQRIRTFTQAVQIVEKIGFEDIKRLASHVSLENGLLSITYPTQS